jgi:g-D-glutamyl-meso-diaminopimelate peptidase
MGFKIDSEFFVRADVKGREIMREHLLAKHPDISGTVIARSILSRPIEAYHVGTGRRYILLAAAHHALESITANFAFAFIDYLMSKSDFGSINGIDCKFLLSKYRFLVIPCVNPDGIDLRFNGVSDSPLKDRQIRMSGGDFNSWQANARGVDLNHNYDYGFNEYKRIEAERGIEPGATLYSGEYPESEPETHGVANLVRTLMPMAVVSLHSQGEEIYAYPKVARIRRCAERLASMTRYTVAEPEGTAAYGGLCDYTASLGIPSFTIEVGKGENPLDESVLPSFFTRVADAIAFLPTIL